MKTVTILGCTGSIGTQTLDVIRRNQEFFSVYALSAWSNESLLAEQIREFSPRVVWFGGDSSRLAREYPSVKFVTGEDSLSEVACSGEIVVVGIVGFAALRPVFAALEAGCSIALANKECLVSGGEIITKLLREGSGKIVPVDSEHSSIYQALRGTDTTGVRQIILTASGGPFLHTPITEFPSLTPEQAVKHPRWSMGAKISVDSATLMNKGLEVIEAAHIFDLPESRVGVVIHPESIVHGFVEFDDESSIACLFHPDMRQPISYALSTLAGIPRLVSTGVPKLHLPMQRSLTYYDVDPARFPALELCREAYRRGGGACTVLNASNEVAVNSFLERKLRFSEIVPLVSSVLEQFPGTPSDSMEAILEADRFGRSATERELKKFS